MNYSILSFSAKLCAMVIGIGAMFALESIPAHATADGPDFFRATGVAEGKTLPVHVNPDPDSKKTGALAAGTNGLKNLGCEGGLPFAEWQKATAIERETARKTRWCRIRHGDIEGWVPGWLIGEGSEE